MSVLLIGGVERGFKLPFLILVTAAAYYNTRKQLEQIIVMLHVCRFTYRYYC